MNLINQEGFMGAMKEAKMTQVLRKGHMIIQHQMCFSSVLTGKDSHFLFLWAEMNSTLSIPSHPPQTAWSSEPLTACEPAQPSWQWQSVSFPVSNPNHFAPVPTYPFRALSSSGERTVSACWNKLKPSPPNPRRSRVIQIQPHRETDLFPRSGLCVLWKIPSL